MLHMLTAFTLTKCPLPLPLGMCICISTANTSCTCTWRRHILQQMHMHARCALCLLSPPLAPHPPHAKLRQHHCASGREHKSHDVLVRVCNKKRAARLWQTCLSFLYNTACRVEASRLCQHHEEGRFHDPGWACYLGTVLPLARDARRRCSDRVLGSRPAKALAGGGLLLGKANNFGTAGAALPKLAGNIRRPVAKR